MADAGTRAADKAQAAMERKMRRIYRQAQREIIEKLNAQTQRMYALDAQKRADVESGKITPQQYKNWLIGQQFTQRQWKDKVDSVATTLLYANQQANAIVEGEKRAVFGENATYAAYEMEHGMGRDLSFSVYDSATVTKLLREDPELLPRRVVNGQKDKAWNRQKISAAVTQGIIQGESIPQIAKRIAKQTASSNMTAMTRYARTAMTSAQNAGRMEAMHHAQEMGIKVQKKWLATLDNRTRDAHAMLDGQVQDVDKPFQSELGPIMFPGDPSADPGNVYNCRCALQWIYPEYVPKTAGQRRDNISGELIKDMTYAEWKAAKEGQKENKEAQDAEIGPNTLDVINSLKVANIQKNQVKPLEKELTEDEIIQRVGGGDMTAGSCASLCLAYAGNNAGYNVLDFRGGDSLEYFCKTGNLIKIAKMDGVQSKIIKSGNDIKASLELLKDMQENKQMILITGKHAAAVRKNAEGYQYLELQSRSNNGWHTLTENILRYRFGCQRSHTTHGYKYETSNMLIDIDSFKKNKGFSEVLSYINTDEDKQRKGASGHER